MKWRTPLALLLASLAACTPHLEYPPPVQRVMPTGADPLPGANLLDLSDPSAQAGVLKDVLGVQAGATWRWTNQNPRFKVWLDPSQRWEFVCRFTVPGVVLKSVGPVTVRFIVNDKILDTRKYSRDEEYNVAKLVPAEIVGGAETAVVGLDIDPVYVAQADGMKLGVLLSQIGLAPLPTR